MWRIKAIFVKYHLTLPPWYEPGKILFKGFTLFSRNSSKLKVQHLIEFTLNECSIANLYFEKLRLHEFLYSQISSKRKILRKRSKNINKLKQKLFILNFILSEVFCFFDTMKHKLFYCLTYFKILTFILETRTEGNI